MGAAATMADLDELALAMPHTTKEVSEQKGIKSLADLCAKASDLTIAARTEFKTREDALGYEGRITRVLDISTLFVPPSNWQGPTGIAYRGNFYLGTLGTFPVRPGTHVQPSRGSS